jgi:hypothetical protein
MTERGTASKWIAMGTLLCCAIQATSAVAGKPTMEECLEGSDFIRNVALSRDAGMAADVFLERMSDDFFAIRAFPAELRWFVHDAGDEMFLAKEARLVFDRPAEPNEHGANFLHVCVDRMTEG